MADVNGPKNLKIRKRSMKEKLKEEVNEALKNQFASKLHDPYLVVMARNYLKNFMVDI